MSRDVEGKLHISLYGGDPVMISPTEGKIIEECLEECKGWMGKWFSMISDWKRCLIHNRRFIWTNWYIISLEAWSPRFFKKFTSTLGTLIKIDLRTLNRVNLNVARILIKTSLPPFLAKECTVNIEGKIFKILIKEEVMISSPFLNGKDSGTILTRNLAEYEHGKDCPSFLAPGKGEGAWLDKWPNSTLKGGGRTVSDHRPIYIEEINKDWGPKPLRLFNWWLKNPSFIELVEKKWNSYKLKGWSGYIIKEKLKLLKGDIKEWRKKYEEAHEGKMENLKNIIEQLDALDDTLGLKN
ncbi:hypothetical protein ACS0TY_031944 [Phlomoides rotata]